MLFVALEFGWEGFGRDSGLIRRASSRKIVALITVGLFVRMANGATHGVVPFVNCASLGSVTGIVGAGGNAGAIAAGFLFRIEGVSPEQAFLWLGAVVAFASIAAFVVSLLASDEERALAAAGDARLAA